MYRYEYITLLDTDEVIVPTNHSNWSDLMKDLVAESGWSVDDIDAFVPHQANKFMLDFLARRMKVPNEKMLLSIQEFGNTSSASIPITIATAGGEHLKKPTKWAFMGFGVGLSWSGLFLETDEIIVPLEE